MEWMSVEASLKRHGKGNINTLFNQEFPHRSQHFNSTEWELWEQLRGHWAWLPPAHPCSSSQVKEQHRDTKSPLPAFPCSSCFNGEGSEKAAPSLCWNPSGPRVLPLLPSSTQLLVECHPCPGWQGLEGQPSLRNTNISAWVWIDNFKGQMLRGLGSSFTLVVKYTSTKLWAENHRKSSSKLTFLKTSQQLCGFGHWFSNVFRCC